MTLLPWNTVLIGTGDRVHVMIFVNVFGKRKLK